MKKKLTILVVALFILTYFIPKTIYADNVWFSADCNNHAGGHTQDYNCICVTKNCPNGDVTNGCTPDMGPNPSAETMQKIEDMYGCSNPPSTSAPYNPAREPSCADPGSSNLGSVDQINCAVQWVQHKQYLSQQQNITPTPTTTPMPTVYIPLPTFTPTPTPTITPSPIIKHSTQIQKPINKNIGFTNNLLENVNKFFGTITQFLKNLTGRR